MHGASYKPFFVSAQQRPPVLKDRITEILITEILFKCIMSAFCVRVCVATSAWASHVIHMPMHRVTGSEPHMRVSSVVARDLYVRYSLCI